MKNIQGMLGIPTPTPSSSNKKGESIHSGQFMVSHIENNDEEEEDVEDKIIEMLEDQVTPPNPCTDLQMYQPPPQTHLLPVATRTDIIDSDLSTVFNTLKVTYTQKLTSPKWNPFKGIRLRWKEKIRLNNVIWRCWHMQFIMKRKALVCQFASPLDVDIHNTPQAILLEGKYWKRKWKVIKNEYIRWRKYNIKALGAPNIIDTKSEIDFLEWSSQNLNDSLSKLTDGMSSDTLFSTIAQYPFPDFREIAKAGRADFIQPSLGPLQPNFDDLMELDLDFFNFSNTRLAPVPEEETNDILRAIDSNFPMIESSSASGQPLVGASGSNSDPDNAPMSVDQVAVGMNQPASPPSYVTQQTPTSMESIEGASHESAGGYLLKNKVPRGYYKSHRREPINYDKQQPTKHQTIIYNQMLAAQQQQQQQVQQSQPPPLTQATLSVQCFPVPYVSNPSMVGPPPLHVSPIQTTTNNYNTPVTQTMADVINLSNPTTTQMIMQQPMTIIQQSPVSAPYKQPPMYATYKQVSFPQPQQRSPPPDSSYMQPNMSQKEMFRSNSLPLNANLVSSFFQGGAATPSKEDQFAVPRYPRNSGTPRSRARSNSINLQRTANQLISGMQSANSEPMLNVTNSALLAQLLSSSSNLVTNKQSMSSGSLTQPHKHQQQQQQVVMVPGTSSGGDSPMHQKALTFPAPSVQNPAHHQSASTGMPTSVLTSLKMSLQQQQQSPMAQTSSAAFSPPATASVSTPSLSPDSVLDIDAPMSPPSRGGGRREEPHRRAGHIHAEQKRRYNIKNGFDMLHSLIPQLQQNPNAKLSKAAMLQKGAEYIRQLRSERTALSERMESLKQEIDALNNSLNHLQTALPANGAPVSRQRNGRMSELYQQSIRNRTIDNWKYWIFGLIFEPMMQSFNQTVSIASMDDLTRTTYNWVDQHCSLVELRPAVSNKLRALSTTTDLLSDSPTSLQDEVRKAMSTSSNSSNKSSSSGYHSDRL